jgi:hypothetical protein
MGAIINPYVKGTSEKIKRTGNRSEVRTVLKTKLHGIMMKSGPVKNAQQTNQCVCIIRSECGRYYIGETSRPLDYETVFKKWDDDLCTKTE